MKRIFFSLVLTMFSLTVFCQTKKIDGIKYTIISATEVEVSSETDATDYVRIRIPKSVKIKKQNYTVKKIASKAFYNCKLLKSVSIPNTVTYIGDYAFQDCKRIEELILPDISACGYGVFDGCKKLQTVKGNTLIFPQWAENEIGYCPFYDNQLSYIKNTYDYYAQNRMLQLLTEWQKKKEYETSTQYQLRVTEENRLKEMKKFLNQARDEYIDRVKPSSMEGTIGTYDADYGIFPIQTQKYGNTFVKVPIEEAKYFKDNWNRVKMNPTYGISDGKLEILSCEFTLYEKIYKSPVSYNKQNSDVAINLLPMDISIMESTDAVNDSRVPVDRSIDMKIPSNSTNNTSTHAIIIGNENYQYVTPVAFAKNDARIFAAYCRRTLGLPDANVHCYENATYGTMLTAIANAKSISYAYNGNINLIFYYAGHGVPNPSDNSAYLMPIDVDGRQTDACMAVSRLYKDLGSMNAKSVTVFMDACFSGAQRGDGMLDNVRGIAIKTKSVLPQGNMIIFSAASGDETAFPYKEKGHGMFTYFLLKKLNETKGNVTLGELGEFITNKVKQMSINVNHKIQTPTVVVSPDIKDRWESLKLR